MPTLSSLAELVIVMTTIYGAASADRQLSVFIVWCDETYNESVLDTIVSEPRSSQFQVK